jgi:hypothetical protein
MSVVTEVVDAVVGGTIEIPMPWARSLLWPGQLPGLGSLVVGTRDP